MQQTILEQHIKELGLGEIQKVEPIIDTKNEQKEDIPYFIKMRGCINCETSKTKKKNKGYPYGFDHEFMFGCVVRDCVKYNVSIAKPFYDPEEVIKCAKRNDTKLSLDSAKKYGISVEKAFGHFYKNIGVSLENIINIC
ncbi:MAG: hypothetical protein KJ906_03575 [Nanoarchaeota archaeon]|nr:hypothetical protein [Nanoarchaeota archaeon]